MTQIQLAHEGHQGQDKTLQPAGDEVEGLAAQTRAETEPLRPIEFPQMVRGRSRVLIKGEDWYLHDIIGQYIGSSWWCRW